MSNSTSVQAALMLNDVRCFLSHICCHAVNVYFREGRFYFNNAICMITTAWPTSKRFQVPNRLACYPDPSPTENIWSHYETWNMTNEPPHFTVEQLNFNFKEKNERTLDFQTFSNPSLQSPNTHTALVKEEVVKGGDSRSGVYHLFQNGVLVLSSMGVEYVVKNA